MRAAVFLGPGQLEVQDVPEPACPAGGVLLEVLACAVCGSDVRIVAHGNRHVTPPQILGHEVVGRVRESRAEGFASGDRLVVAPAIGCGQCRWCRRGRPNICPALRTIGYYYPGAFAHLLPVTADAVAQGSLLPVPPALDDHTACLTEPLACCLNGQELVDVGPGDRVVIVGAGPIGVLHARLAKARGAAQVMLVEQRPERRQRALDLELGQVLGGEADVGERIRALTSGDGCDVAITAAPSGEAQAAALGWLARGGRLSLFGGLPPQHPAVPLETNRIHYHELLVTGAHGSSPAQNRAAMALLASGEVSADGLVTATFPLEATAAAVATMAKGHGLKTVVHVGGD